MEVKLNLKFKVNIYLSGDVSGGVSGDVSGGVSGEGLAILLSSMPL